MSEVAPLSKLVEVNPPRRLSPGLGPKSLVSFIPMSDVSDGGEWGDRQTRLLAEVSTGYTAFAEGDILFAKITPCMENGKGTHAVHLVNGIGFGSTEFHVLRARDGVDPRFVYHWTQSSHLRLRAESFMIGSAGQRRVQASFFDHFLVAKLEVREQRTIATILDTLDGAILGTEQLVAKLRQMKQGLCSDLLARGVDESGALRDPERHPEQFRDSAVGRLPTAWHVSRLLDMVTLPSGQLDPRLEPYRAWPLIAPDHIEAGTGRLLAMEAASSQGAISGKYAFKAGDVLYSKIRPYLRKAVLADCEGLCSADMYPLRPGAQVRPRFLLAVVLGEDFSRFAESVSMRSGFPKINREELGEYSLGLPDLAEQDRIGQVLSTFDERLAHEESLLSKLRLLKQGLAQDLLTAHVRVTKLLAGDAA